MIWLVVLIGTGCTASTTIDAAKADARLDTLLDAAVRDENGELYRNAAIKVSMPGYEYEGAAGIARVDTGETMTVDHQFAIASVGKPMTAAIIYQLWEEGAFGPKGLDSTL
ncbi:MAG: serine hydrolase, partial [Anaerolineae bacterium]|nr:serine hydrolase [Anaerolineae bacterium]